jgi:hypothetical protein
LSILHGNRATGKNIVGVFQWKRLGNFDNRIFPTFTNRRKTDLRRKSWSDYNNPVIRQMAGETDAAVRECSGRVKRQIIAALEEIGMLAPKLQGALR